MARGVHSCRVMAAPSPAGAIPGRLRARPTPSPKRPIARGERPFGTPGAEEAILFVPSSYEPASPAPLLLCLHGSGGVASHRIDPLRPFAEDAGVVLLAPTSAGRSWDLVLRGLGPDVERIDALLARAFDEIAVDPARIGIEGFSDGASYALSLGLTNGDLFCCIFAFSPGFVRPAANIGSPRVFITHGTHDAVLPISCSRRIAPALMAAGYDVTYDEVEIAHTVPVDAIERAIDVLAG